MLLGSHAKHIIKGMVPGLFHIVLICNDAVFNWVLERKDASF